MAAAFQAFPISDRVYWVGAIDWDLRNFHGYRTSHGTTYNAYLLMADQVTLLDTVRAPFVEEMLSRIASVTDLRSIRHVISNHAEMDHSAGLGRVLDLAPEAALVASAPGVKALRDHFHWDREVRAVATGETLDLGNERLRFLEARMLHWPDSMFSYLESQEILFSNDAFGMHLASAERFADELDPALCRHEAAKYYANILLPFSPVAAKMLAKLPAQKIAPRVIAPDHGPVWRRQPEQIVKLYGRWAAQKPTRRAVVIYDTMWQSTARLARAVGEGLAAGGAEVSLLNLDGSHRSDVATEILEAGALLVGSPTINNQIFPTVAEALVYLKGLKRKNLIGAAFGSYGWSGEAVPQIEEMLGSMGVELAGEGLRQLYVPDEEGLAAARALGGRVAAKLEERVHAEI
jgi:flavorubredoxin